MAFKTYFVPEPSNFTKFVPGNHLFEIVPEPNIFQIRFMDCSLSIANREFSTHSSHSEPSMVVAFGDNFGDGSGEDLLGEESARCLFAAGAEPLTANKYEKSNNQLQKSKIKLYSTKHKYVFSP